MTVAMFPGTFDPVTNGHLDLIVRSARIFDKLIVAIFDNPQKRQMFNVEERRHLLEQVTEALDNVEINSFQNTLLHLPRKTVSGVMYSSAGCGRWPTSNTKPK